LSTLINRKIKGLILEKEPIARHTSFKIGGTADFLVIPKVWDDVYEVIDKCNREKIPYRIMGQGSNILVSDEGVEGIVIKINRSLGSINRVERGIIRVEAGCLISDLLSYLVNNNLGGLEFLAGIPGNIGGAVFGNAGAWGEAIGKCVEMVDIIDKDLREKTLRREDLVFSYRRSNINEGIVIKSVYLKVFEQDGGKTKDKILRYLYERNRKLPKLPSAGSIFKNPPNQSAGYLIEQVGLKGYRVGNVMVSYEHANIIVNLGEGKAKDVMNIIEIVKEKVYKKFNISLELEIKVW